MISIVMTTYLPLTNPEQRLERAAHCAYSWAKHLYAGTSSGEVRDDIRLIVQDDNSLFDSVKMDAAIALAWRRGGGNPALVSWQRGMGGVGASLNRGQAMAWETGPLTLYAVDDWSLEQQFDLTPWMQLLEEREDVGCVRLGPPHPSMVGEIRPFTSNWQGWGAALQLDNGMVVSHRPALWHKRFFDWLGPWKENVSALECEANMNTRFRQKGGGQDVVLALPHPWYHLQPKDGDTSLSAMNPETRQ